MVTSLQHKTPHCFKIKFEDQNTTAFAGLVLIERMAARLGLWNTLEGELPSRRGHYDWLTIIKAISHGLLSGSRGTVAAEELRNDAALLDVAGLEAAPEEVTVWRALEGLGQLQLSGRLARVQMIWAKRLLARARRNDLMHQGFVPIFGDGTLLEGSANREGTKHIGDKGSGLMWSTIFVGPAIAAQRLAAQGEGEQSNVREMLPEVVDGLLKPLKLHKLALLLLDSLHGDEPTLQDAEALSLRYIIGANKLKETDRALAEQAESQWRSTGARPGMGWVDSGVCACWLQCREWGKKYLLVGRRWKREGEMFWHHCGVLTNLNEKDVAHVGEGRLHFAEAVWRLYDMKGGLETQYKEALSDLGLHHPPCREHVRNAGYYAVGAMAHLLGVGVDLLGGKSEERGSRLRKDGGKRKRARPRRMRLWRLRRRLWALAGRVATHARVLTVTLLGVGPELREEFERYWQNICRC